MTRGTGKKKRTPRPTRDSVASAPEALEAKKCQDCSEWQMMRQKLRVSELLLKAIEGFESKMNAEDFKPTVTEYLKLLQMQQEIDAIEDKPKEIKVTWVDPTTRSDPEK